MDWAEWIEYDYFCSSLQSFVGLMVNLTDILIDSHHPFDFKDDFHTQNCQTPFAAINRAILGYTHSYNDIQSSLYG